jgi:hypothetical protein
MRVYGVGTEILLAEFQLASGASGININNTGIATAGTDANISLNLQSKGTGGIFLQAPAGTTRITINGSTGAVSIPGTLSAGVTTITGTALVGSTTSGIRVSNNALTSIGTDNNIPITFQTKGSGNFVFTNGTTTRLTINTSSGLFTINGTIISGSISITGTGAFGNALSALEVGSNYIQGVGTDVNIPIVIASKNAGIIYLRTGAVDRLTINGATGLVSIANDLSVTGNHTQTGTSTLTGRVGIGKAPHATYACDIMEP